VNKKVCIITGANSGIGKQAAIQMAKAGYHVVLGCRSKERGETALAEVKQASSCGDAEVMQIDLSLKASTKRFAQEIKDQFDVVDVLILNAAVFDITQKQAVITAEGYESVWMTNHVNAVYLTDLLLNSLKKSENGRIITIASKGLLAMPGLKVDLEDPEFKRRKFNMTKAYYQSKRAQIMFTYALAEKLKHTNVTVNCIRVPAVQIDISRHPELSAFTKWMYRQKSKRSITPEEMARTYTYLATSDAVRHVTGKYFDENNHQVNSNAYTHDQDMIDAVMVLTYQYLD
jgi:NAD(P)-dependent dehydrogenase (short-subunit alcohol dehydrogenase family)